MGMLRRIAGQLVTGARFQKFVVRMGCEIGGGHNEKAAEYQVMQNGTIGVIPEFCGAVGVLNGKNLSCFGSQAEHAGLSFLSRQLVRVGGKETVDRRSRGRRRVSS